VVLNTVLPQLFPELFLRNTVIHLVEVNKTCGEIFGRLPRFLKNYLESANLVCSAIAEMKSPLDILQLFNYFAASCFKALGIHFSREATDRGASVVSPVFLLVCQS